MLCSRYKLLFAPVYFKLLPILTFAGRTADHTEDAASEVPDEVGVYSGHVEVEEAPSVHDADVEALTSLAGEDAGKDAVDAVETDVPEVIMAVEEGPHEGQTGSVGGTPDHGMAAYCGGHEGVSWADAPGEGKMEVPLSSPSMEHYVLVDVVEL